MSFGTGHHETTKLMLDYILEFDRELLLYLNSLGQEPWDGFWFAVTNKWSSIPLYVLLLFLMAKGLGKKGVVLLVFCLATMITFTDQVTNLFKDGFEPVSYTHLTLPTNREV